MQSFLVASELLCLCLCLAHFLLPTEEGKRVIDGMDLGSSIKHFLVGTVSLWITFVINLQVGLSNLYIKFN